MPPSELSINDRYLSLYIRTGHSVPAPNQSCGKAKLLVSIRISYSGNFVITASPVRIPFKACDDAGESKTLFRFSQLKVLADGNGHATSADAELGINIFQVELDRGLRKP